MRLFCLEARNVRNYQSNPTPIRISDPEKMMIDFWSNWGGEHQYNNALIHGLGSNGFFNIWKMDKSRVFPHLLVFMRVCGPGAKLASFKWGVANWAQKAGNIGKHWDCDFEPSTNQRTLLSVRTNRKWAAIDSLGSLIMIAWVYS